MEAPARRPHRRWTAEEDRRLAEPGVDVAALAAELGRTPWSVRGRMYTLAAPGALQRRIDRALRRYKRVKKAYRAAKKRCNALALTAEARSKRLRSDADGAEERTKRMRAEAEALEGLLALGK